MVYVSRLVYMIALLEAVLWIQPNFALSWQHDMTKLLQTQTDNLNQLAQNVAGANLATVFQKQMEMIARELEMAERANVQVRNMQDSLLDKGTAKQATNDYNPTQNLPQLYAEANNGGNKGNHGTIAGKSANEGVTSGAVPLMTNSQAFAVACCLIFACFSAFSNDFVSESSDSDASSVSSPKDESVMKRPRDFNDEDEDEESDEESFADMNECRRGRKRARLGMRATSSVHFSQAKKNCRKHHAKKNDSHYFNGSEVASDETTVSSCASPSSTLASPKDIHVSSPMSSSIYSTLPPELAGNFEAEHAFYFHGISCPGSSSPMVSVPVSPIHPSLAASPSLESSVCYHEVPQHVTAIDPSLLMEPGSPQMNQQDSSFTSVSSDHSSEVDEAEDEESESANVTTLFGVTVEPPLMQDVFF